VKFYLFFKILYVLLFVVDVTLQLFDFFLFICNIYNETNCWVIPKKMYKQRQLNSSI